MSHLHKGFYINIQIQKFTAKFHTCFNSKQLKEDLNIQFFYFVQKKRAYIEERGAVDVNAFCKSHLQSNLSSSPFIMTISCLVFITFQFLHKYEGKIIISCNPNISHISLRPQQQLTLLGFDFSFAFFAAERIADFRLELCNKRIMILMVMMVMVFRIFYSEKEM